MVKLLECFCTSEHVKCSSKVKVSTLTGIIDFVSNIAYIKGY